MPLVLVTGSSDGIGKETARQLLAEGAEVIVHGRTQLRADKAIGDLGAGQRWVCDFSSLEEVRAATGKLPAGIDVLINNAGVYMKERVVTRDGYETTFQGNHLAPVLLTNLLLPSMA